MEGNRRKFYLREQLKVIKKELGEEGEDGGGGPAQNEIEELTEKLSVLDLPPEAEKAVKKDLQVRGSIFPVMVQLFPLYPVNHEW